jgi:methionine synthase II (cobalamin-independent)
MDADVITIETSRSDMELLWAAFSISSTIESTEGMLGE